MTNPTTKSLTQPYLLGSPKQSGLTLEGQYAWCRGLTRYRGYLEPGEQDDEFGYAGFDTGTRNAGLATILGNEFNAWQITWGDFPSYAEGVEYVYHLIKNLADDDRVRLYGRPGVAVIEAGAFSRNHSSATTGMEAIRTAALLALVQLHYQVEMRGPSTITKLVLGSGKLRAKEVWANDLGPDAAAAFGCALLARKLGRH